MPGATRGRYGYWASPAACAADPSTRGAACIDIQHTQERDGKHQLPALTVFTEPEIDTIEALVPTLEGKTDRQQNPHPSRSLARASAV